MAETFLISGGLSGEMVAVPVSALNPLPVVGLNPSGPTTNPATAAAGASFSIVTGGTAQNVFAAASITNGAVIHNPFAATENLFVDVVNAAQAAEPGSNGTTTAVPPGSSFNVPGGLTTAVSVIAATTAHTFTAWKY